MMHSGMHPILGGSQHYTRSFAPELYPMACFWRARKSCIRDGLEETALDAVSNVGLRCWYRKLP